MFITNYIRKLDEQWESKSVIEQKETISLAVQAMKVGSFITGVLMSACAVYQGMQGAIRNCCLCLPIIYLSYEINSIARRSEVILHSPSKAFKLIMNEKMGSYDMVVQNVAKNSPVLREVGILLARCMPLIKRYIKPHNNEKTISEKWHAFKAKIEKKASMAFSSKIA